jgi:hypothetical protein
MEIAGWYLEGFSNSSRTRATVSHNGALSGNEGGLEIERSYVRIMKKTQLMERDVDANINGGLQRDEL